MSGLQCFSFLRCMWWDILFFDYYLYICVFGLLCMLYVRVICFVFLFDCFFFFKQKTAYEMRISDWSSDVCSSDLDATARASTEHGERLLTPRYAAPEQIRGEPATMASDVYALGLLLHELLTGTHPFEAAVSTPEDMQRAILEDSPAPPSLTDRKSTRLNSSH